MTPPRTIAVAIALALAACAEAPPRQYARIAPSAAAAHAHGDQVGIVASMGAPDTVSTYLPSGVTRWVYCRGNGNWTRVIDFDSEGNILISIEYPDVGTCAI